MTRHRIGIRAVASLGTVAAIVIGCFVLNAAWSGGASYYGQADLAMVNHPDLFQFKFQQDYSSNTVENTEAVTRVPTPRPTTNINRPLRGNPIPLNELDNSLVQRVHFDYDKSDLKPDAVNGITVNSHWIKKHTEFDILLEGHCDERGTEEYNIALGERRSASVKSYLVELGVDADRIMTRSWGEEKPLDDRHFDESYSLNRRVEFYAVPLK